MKIGQSKLELTGYQTATSIAGFYQQADAGYLVISDRDHEAFLQRQTSNDINLLTPEHTIVTILLSPTARILDVLRLLRLPKSIMALTLPAHSASTAQFLQSRIFFMDKVTVRDASNDYAQIDLFGPHAEDILRDFGGLPIPPKNGVAIGVIDNSPVKIIAQLGLAGLGYRLIVGRAHSPAIQTRLAALGAVELSTQTFQTLRVEAGLPAAQSELTADYTPLETGLQTAVHQEKGCYTGQEILARQITYDKITQRLVGLRLSQSAEPGERLLTDGKPAGKVTSYALSPRYGPIALAIVKRPYHEAGTLLTSKEAGAKARVIDLPFSQL